MCFAYLVNHLILSAVFTIQDVQYVHMYIEHDLELKTII